MIEASKFNSVVENAFEEKAPHKICSYIYDFANAFNRFYHETKILSEEDAQQKASWISLLELVREILETCIDMLGFSAPDRMKRSLLITERCTGYIISQLLKQIKLLLGDEEISGDL